MIFHSKSQMNWTVCVQDRSKWRDVVEKAKTVNIRRCNAQRRRRNKWHAVKKDFDAKSSVWYLMIIPKNTIKRNIMKYIRFKKKVLLSWCNKLPDYLSKDVKFYWTMCVGVHLLNKMITLTEIRISRVALAISHITPFDLRQSDWMEIYFHDSNNTKTGALIYRLSRRQTIC
jgi:hypothetical protein